MKLFICIITLLLLIISSGLDAILTMVVLEAGVALEANMLMEALIDWSVMGFIVFKLFFPASLVGILMIVDSRSGSIVGLSGVFLFSVIALNTAIHYYAITFNAL